MPDLSEYRAKRDPARTPEPFGEGAPDVSGNRFVVQEHHARRLHYDVRLERDGVLVSWAVPRGLPEEPGAPRLAVHTEDHPLSYLDFHGEIPAGEYGGGSMSIWDHGRYETEKWSDDEVAVTLHGERVQGRFVFFRPDRDDQDAKDWLVQRRRTDTPPAPRDAQAPRVNVGGRALRLSNLDKELYPGVPKAAVVDYYARVADTLLPHLAGRPLTLRRFPDGIAAPSFYEKNAGAKAPDWLRTVRVPTPGSSRGSATATFVVVEELATLVYLANLAVLELHVPQWRVDDEGRVQPPDELVFDLDPGEGSTVLDCARVAERVRDLVAADGLVLCPKTSGSKGMQVSAAIRVDDPARTSAYARSVAEHLARETPRGVTAVMAKERRRGKVFVDWSQNNPSKTTVAPYSLRARAAHGAPTVSTPLTWDEVAAAGTVRELTFSPADVLARIGDRGDLYAAALGEGVDRPELPERPSGT
ncbi:non-homologous end-joining DNA ligase [Actinomycetospora cinnamomea]|uniref:DNA ligase D-like protein (Predicted 3'-phosphoesterase)/DNA ligase D-like protein (Predicted polymerase) n=1 Tax=Actinomycetospora cinnamomea TaxID=663609 RepID=A0A2U1EU09_9PSEU|nr:non-homologous end-joining DNA ligase [Actinomycetospora cinnamomea]PVZ03418.1 DNA ligase D-like protein (predicted 3'-phosphoesterase)/DNA ligase D-like protein (predicted polymerase) [Actinomycetospora cinnamomea]